MVQFYYFSRIWLLLPAILILSDRTAAQHRLVPPNLKDCQSRIGHDTFNGTQYFFSWENPDTRDLKVNWLTGRNICRRHCMDLVSIETKEENEFIKNKIISAGVRFAWTSGRKCNFPDCDNRTDLMPIMIKGWFWSGSNVRIPANADQTRVSGDWSHTGGDGRPQPDNREFLLTGSNDESCIAMLNNYYNDGVVWHDIACHHKKPFICEDNPDLLRYMRQLHPSAQL